MKIAHINAGNELGGGLTHIVSLLNELQQDDIDLIVFEEGPVAKAARREGIPVYVFAQKSRYDVGVLFRLRRFINEQNYSIIHTHGPRANTLIALLKPFMTAYWVMTVHSHPLLDFNDRGFKGKVFETIHLKTFKKAEGIITVSNEIKGFMQSLGVPSNCVEVIHNGIKFSESNDNLRKKVSSPFTLVTIGRLNKIKGYALMMEAMNHSNLEDWQWILCGDGEELAPLKKCAEKYGLTQRIDFKGWLSDFEIKQVLSQADVLVSPSFSETFPIVLLEAANEKVPVIATNVGDVEEIIKDESKGWLIPPNSKESLKQALSEAESLWKNDQLREKGENLNKWAVRFSIARQAQAVQLFYKKMIAKNKK